jgi:hypothetical protein
MEETKPIEWHEIKGAQVGMKGDQVICIVERVEGLPFEAYGVNPMSAVYRTLDAAKSEAEAGHTRFLEAQKGQPQSNFYLDILKQVVAALEAKAKPAA